MAQSNGNLDRVAARGVAPPHRPPDLGDINLIGTHDASETIRFGNGDKAGISVNADHSN